MPSARSQRRRRTPPQGLAAASTTLPQVVPLLPLTLDFGGKEGDRDAVAAVDRTVVVITGASSGVGRATAHAFARRGARIGLVARGEDALRATAREVEELGGDAIAVHADVADPEQLEAAAETVERAFGSIDVWINSAATSVFAPAWRASAEETRRVTEVTYLGAAYGALTALRRMRPRNHGTIVMVGAALAYRGMPLCAAYCAAKHAIHGFTESLRCELMHEGSNVHVTTVNLPALNTPQLAMARSRLKNRAKPMGPIFQPEVAAEGIVWAVAHRRRELSVGGSTSLRIWTTKFAPGLTERYLARTGYDQQQSAELDDPSRPDNLFEPIPGDHGTHGPFDRDAVARSPHLWLTTHRAAIASGTAALFALAVAIGAFF